MIKVFLDFGDGVGERNVSHLLAPGAVIQPRLSNDDFTHAVGTVSFKLYHDSTITSNFISATGNIKVRFTENDEPLFYGHIPPTAELNSNGKCDGISPLELEAEDDSSLFDIDTETEIVIEGAYLCNAAHPESSILHYLSSLVGIDSSRIIASDSDLKIACFTIDKDGNIATALHSILFEYGYLLKCNESGTFDIYKWNQGSYAPTSIVGENVRKAIKVEKIESQYKSAKVTWTPALKKNGVMLYNADLPFADDGTRLGYPVQPTHYYPEEAELEETWLDYDDTAIDYHTEIKLGEEVAVKEKNYTGILKTSNHYLEVKTDDGLTLETQIYENLRARIAYKNTTASALKIYYLKIHADVLYRGSESETKSGTGKVYTYKSTYIFDSDNATLLVGGLMKRLTTGRYRYKFVAYTKWCVGSTLRLVDSNLGIDTNALVISYQYNVDDGSYSYRLISVTAVTQAIRTINYKKTSSLTSNISTEYRYMRSSSIPETPTASEPIGWSTTIPSGTETLWIISAKKNSLSGILLTGWSTPSQFSATDGKSPLSVEVESTKGILLRKGKRDTVLIAHVYDAFGEVTDQLSSSQFVWYRTSESPSDDTVWNLNHATGYKTVTLTDADFYGDTSFKCEIREVS